MEGINRLPFLSHPLSPGVLVRCPSRPHCSPISLYPLSFPYSRLVVYTSSQNRLAIPHFSPGQHSLPRPNRHQTGSTATPLNGLGLFFNALFRAPNPHHFRIKWKQELFFLRTASLRNNQPPRTPRAVDIQSLSKSITSGLARVTHVFLGIPDQPLDGVPTKPPNTFRPSQVRTNFD